MKKFLSLCSLVLFFACNNGNVDVETTEMELDTLRKKVDNTDENISDTTKIDSLSGS